MWLSSAEVGASFELDIGHSAKTLELHKIWSRRVTEEFWNQGDYEIKLGVGLTQLCDRKINIAKGQEGFLNFLALPLFENFGKFFNKNTDAECAAKYQQVCVAQLKRNRDFWKSRAEKGDAGNIEFLRETDHSLKMSVISPTPVETILSSTSMLAKT